MIITTGWLYAGPLISILFQAVVVASSWRISREAVKALQTTPAGVHADSIGSRIRSYCGVAGVRDVRIWANAAGIPRCPPMWFACHPEDCDARRRELTTILADDFEFSRTTLQLKRVVRAGAAAGPAGAGSHEPGVP